MTVIKPTRTDAKAVARGLIPSPFDARLRPFSLYQDWMPWAGYVSPRRYDTVEAEYFAIRNQATLFDVSPMHKYRITGPDATQVMNRLVTRDVTKMRDMRVGYSLWCDEDGHVIDDGTVFRFSPTDYRLCSQEPQYSWLHDITWGFDVTIEDESHSIAGLSLQGPTSFAVLERAGFAGVEAMKPFDMMHADGDTLISRTGFTGDLGYEIWCPAEKAEALFDRLWPAGSDFGLRPIGFDALNMTRIEAGFIAPGVDFQSSHHALRPTRGRTPFELGFGRLVAFDKGHFNGRRALLDAQKRGPRYVLVGLDIEGHKPADGAFIYHRKKKEAGHVTSALWSPTCKRNLAVAELKVPFGTDILSDLWAEIYHHKEGKWERVMARATVAERPFFKHARRGATPPGRY
ncbi:aminomethyltransferase family protein [Pacificispira sp.]|uniref:aminomethyltransferase family protein n=1 Tax=Pacificispira sp. TaxID=2888761 RepID=UPI003BAC5C75